MCCQFKFFRSVNKKMNDILEILDKNGPKITNEQIAHMTGKTEEEVASEIAALEKKGVIFGYRTMINWEKTDKEIVSAIIELRVTPQRGEGFDTIAKRIYKYPQVKSVYLMSSGTYDLAVMIDGASMKEIAMFVAEKLATMDTVISTSTHFVLKKYKENGFLYEDDEKDSRQVITL